MAFEDFKIGMKAHTSKTITETDVILFAGVSTDINPVHLDEEKTFFFIYVCHAVVFIRMLGKIERCCNFR